MIKSLAITLSVLLVSVISSDTFRPLKVYRLFPDPGTLYPLDTYSGLAAEFNYPIQEYPYGNLTVFEFESNSIVWQSNVRSPFIWFTGARLALDIPKQVFVVGREYGVRLDAKTVLSAPEGFVFEDGISENLWKFKIVESLESFYFNSAIPSNAQKSESISFISALMNRTNIFNSIHYLSTQFYNRFYDSESGRASLLWVEQFFEETANANSDMKDSINIRQFEHSWRMPSLIVRLKAVNPSDEVVVIGAHLDSINRQNWRINVWTGRAPGANDDATGVAILMEMFRVFVQHKVRPISRSLEIHIYSGEEEGLYGSRDISAEYFRNHVKVASMLQLDQCGWLRNSSDEKIAIYTDHTDPKLTSLLKDLTLEYVSNASIIIDNENNRADSDFHSWHINGYRAAYVSEGPIDDIVYGNSKHTSYDLDKTVSMDHVMKFASIAVAYSLELTKTALLEQ